MRRLLFYAMAPLLIVGLLAGCGDAQQKLIEAVRTGDTKAAARALEKGADVVGEGPDGMTPIEAAVSASDGEMVRVLLHPPLVVRNGFVQKPNWHNVDELYETALDLDDGTVAIEIARKFVMTFDDPLVRWVSKADGVALLADPHLRADTVVELPETTRVGVTSMSDFRFELGGRDARWVFVTTSTEGQAREGFMLDFYLTDRDLEALRVVTINQERQIDTPDGLRMRNSPGLSGSHVATIPGGDLVFAIRSEGEDLTIDGRTDRWTYVEWRNNRGWVFGGYLRSVSDRPPYSVWFGAPYHSEYYNSSEPGDFGKEDLSFDKGNKAVYVRSENYYQGFEVFSHEGYFYYEGSRVYLVFGEGERKMVAEGTSDPSPVSGFTMVLVWRDDPEIKYMTSLIKLEDLQRVQDGEYRHDLTAHQYVPLDENSQERIGYFMQTEK